MLQNEVGRAQGLDYIAELDLAVLALDILGSGPAVAQSRMELHIHPVD